MRKSIFIATLTLLACSPATGDIYKWVDDKGVTHYSDNAQAAPQNHQRIDAELPPVHRMDKPDARLSRIQRQAQKERSAQAAASRRQHTTPRPTKSPCASLERQLRSVQSQLRRGYREPRGNKLRERRRDLEARLINECR